MFLIVLDPPYAEYGIRGFSALRWLLLLLMIYSIPIILTLILLFVGSEESPEVRTWFRTPRIFKAATTQFRKVIQFTIYHHPHLPHTGRQ